MPWTRRRASLAALAACAVLLTATAACDADGTQDQGTAVSSSPVGKVLDTTDADGRHYREVDGDGAPAIGLEVVPDDGGAWDVRLKLTRFTLSRSATSTKAVSGQGTARLYVDGQALADLRTPSYRIPAGYLTHGTHQVTVRLYADDGTVWAVDGKPVQSTADITASEPVS